jgi:hypothetical protein
VRLCVLSWIDEFFTAPLERNVILLYGGIENKRLLLEITRLGLRYFIQLRNNKMANPGKRHFEIDYINCWGFLRFDTRPRVKNKRSIIVFTIVI